MNDQDLLRYARHILLNELGIEGQEKLLQARVLILGAGGLGAPAALYLAGAGVGHITLVDDDVVELSNLQRQIIHTTGRLDYAKVESARQALHELNPSVQIDTIGRRLMGHDLENEVAKVDLVLDCCDNFATRHAVNRACVLHRKPLISGAAIRFAGQVSVYDMRDEASPCYHCLFPEADEADEVSCATTGVLGPLVGIIGSTQAAEAIKLITGMGRLLVGRLLCLDALTMQWSSIGLKRDPGCPVCGHR